jgi:hypothetical protein
VRLAPRKKIRQKFRLQSNDQRETKDAVPRHLLMDPASGVSLREQRADKRVGALAETARGAALNAVAAVVCEQAAE